MYNIPDFNIETKGAILTSLMETMPNGQNQPQQIKVLPPNTNIRTLPVTSGHSITVYQTQTKTQDTNLTHSLQASSSNLNKFKDPGILLVPPGTMPGAGSTSDTFAKRDNEGHAKQISVYSVINSTANTVGGAPSAGTTDGNGSTHLMTVVPSSGPSVSLGGSIGSTAMVQPLMKKNVHLKAQVVSTGTMGATGARQQINSSRIVSLTSSTGGETGGKAFKATSLGTNSFSPGTGVPPRFLITNKTPGGDKGQTKKYYIHTSFGKISPHIRQGTPQSGVSVPMRTVAVTSGVPAGATLTPIIPVNANNGTETNAEPDSPLVHPPPSSSPGLPPGRQMPTILNRKRGSDDMSSSLTTSGQVIALNMAQLASGTPLVIKQADSTTMAPVSASSIPPGPRPLSSDTHLSAQLAHQLVECSPSRKRPRKQHLNEVRSELMPPATNSVSAVTTSAGESQSATNTSLPPPTHTLAGSQSGGAGSLEAVATSGVTVFNHLLSGGGGKYCGPTTLRMLSDASTRPGYMPVSLVSHTAMLGACGNSYTAIPVRVATSEQQASVPATQLLVRQSALQAVSVASVPLQATTSTVTSGGASQIQGYVDPSTSRVGVPSGSGPPIEASETDSDVMAGGSQRAYVRPQLPYKVAWKPRRNHFQRYDDVHAKKVVRPSVHELINQKSMRKIAVGWHATKASYQLRILKDNEDIDLEMMKVIKDRLNTFMVESQWHGEDVEQAGELIEGICQRKRMLIANLNTTASDISSLMSTNCDSVFELMEKFKSKRPTRRK